jgi:jumonji domain-containing protein 7
VEPGETLYIPSYWWHEVQSEPGPWPASPGVLGSIAVNTWFDPVVTREFPCSVEECPFRVDTGVYGDVLDKIGQS